MGLADDAQIANQIASEPHNVNPKGSWQMAGAKEYCIDNFEYTSDADIAIYPEKYTGQPLPPEYTNYKVVLCLMNDDSDTSFTNLPSNVILLRTSFYKSTRHPNEYGLAVFCPDYYRGVIIPNGTLPSVGFCGFLTGRRGHLLNVVNESKIKTNFTVRRRPFCCFPNPVERTEYFDHMESNYFVFCHRGSGNFSFRFYEILMMGRIPLLFDTDCMIPQIDKLKGIVILSEPVSPRDVYVAIQTFVRTHDMEQVQRDNRAFWEKYYSPVGFLTNLKAFIDTQDRSLLL